ncbi:MULTISPECIES: FtsK/SpoIIIE domain-containing protein [unclassified Nocardioides]|uniref:FtsK/SpoIIIE domain-containing protein n=1 Tax=unclassified Nocardioides TaxID=2615069 RepID=UPI0009F047B1|nr:MULTISPECIES: FtsK/SpoIIIE domain-containing protein [unclassified Nocardioides]GAW47747.1 hypothetical protein PD653B2_0054 [Nocardioides sp. PD653-B2]GAW56207.1 hypothetical protein PD653_3643 [Nocardioides sp. PD653]
MVGDFSIWTELGFTGNPYDQRYLPGSEEGVALFHGRVSERRRVQLGLGSGGSHVLIVGEAGVGKTSLAQVAAFDMFRRGRAAGAGTLFVPIAAPMQLKDDPYDFELDVWRNIASALISNRRDIELAGLQPPDLHGLSDWLSAPTTLTSGSATALGFGGGGARALNTTTAFGESGFVALVRQALVTLFPSTASGGVICILDNLELSGSADAARSALEALRSTLFEVPAIRWVFIGSRGVASGLRSRRLSGFIDQPVRLEPLTVEESVESIRRRLDYWGTTNAHPPVQPEDFRYLYRTLGLNLRDSLNVAQQFAQFYFGEFIGTDVATPTDEERPLYFQAWLGERADEVLAEAPPEDSESWLVFDQVRDGGGTLGVAFDDLQTRRHMQSLVQANLLVEEPDPESTDWTMLTITANGWLAAFARARVEAVRRVPTGSPEADHGPKLAERRPDTGPPQSARLVDLLGPGWPSVDAVEGRWRTGLSSTAAVIGTTPVGPFTLDLRKDGPHALVAGTTGSGKSQLLQTLVLSLASVNRPDQITFLLVDYKGGSAFQDCVVLPHTVGLLTDIDRHASSRILTSLGAELVRREQILADAQAKDIEDYGRLQSLNANLDAMPRLVIVIDEFASLMAEVPEVVSGLVAVASRGRSLGIHLVLGTQRPAGALSPEILANTNIRIALRLSTVEDSVDVIGVPDASHVSSTAPGRGFARLGHSGLIGIQIARLNNGESGGVDEFDGGGPSDDRQIVRAINEAYDKLALERPRRPVLPSLASVVLLGDLLPRTPTRSTIPPVPFALEDLPSLQRQRVATIDLDNFSTLAIVGSARTGRSTALVTVAAAVARSTSPADVHLYVFDGGAGSLLAMSGLPHCGAVVTRGEHARARQLLNRLSKELDTRRRRLASGRFATIREQRSAMSAADRMPHILVLVDRWKDVCGGIGQSDDAGANAETLMRLLREGPAVGIYSIVTGGQDLLASAMRAVVGDYIALPLADRAAYRQLGLDPNDLPEDAPPGRGFRSISGIELQIASLSADPDRRAQSDRLREIAVDLAEQYADTDPTLLPTYRDV